MRDLYRTMVEVRALGRLWPARRLPRGLEACWVASVIDLRPGDLVSDAHAGQLVNYIRTVGSHSATRSATSKAWRAALDRQKHDAAPSLARMDRLLYASGMATALQSFKQGNAVLVFVSQGELTPAEWTRLLGIAAQNALPLVFVFLSAPGRPKAALDLQRIANRLAPAFAPPIVQVDAGDAVALYRVAQESLVRVRTDGGPVIVHCLPSELEPVASLARQLLAQGICSARWLASVDASVARLKARM